MRLLLLHGTLARGKCAGIGATGISALGAKICRKSQEVLGKSVLPNAARARLDGRAPDVCGEVD